jgi:alpha-D-ribose 1-methylphosphonate 5-triphosphate synthase subunit PhnG
MSTGMFTFQGDFKRRAQVNLGRARHEDRTALLKKAQEERKAREEKRRRELAAMKIQVTTLLRSSSIVSDF